MKEFIVRFFIGGSVVSLFALISDLFQPKRFAGLFGAAPSVALATLALTAASRGKSYASLEARSMAVGAVAFFIYAFAVRECLFRLKSPPLATTSLLLGAWLAAAFGMWAAFLR